MARKKSKRKEWGMFSFLLFLIGFFGIHKIILSNFILEPAGLTESITILFFKVSPAEVITNAFDMAWGMIIWSSVKQIL
jgi:hypothetical protein